MNVVSFFSGAGGMDLGFCLAGHNIIWSNDFDEYAVSTYNQNIAGKLNHEALCCDIVKLLDCDRNAINEIIPDCDIIIGGFPCQGFSIANLNRSMEDDKNFLYLQLLKAISVKQPPYFLLENVKGLENMEGGKVLDMILDDLSSAGTKSSKLFPSDGVGYTVVYNVLNAYNFGVPQNRERVIILGVRNDIDNPVVRSHIGNKKRTRKNLLVKNTHSIDSNCKETQTPFEKVNKMYEQWKKGKPVLEQNCATIFSAKTVRDAIFDLPRDYDLINYKNHVGSKCKVKITGYVGNRKTAWDKPSPTIMGRGSGTGGPLLPPHPDLHRRITVREAARIQTFPDDFFFEGPISACYRQIGNAVPVLLAYNIAKIFVQEY